MRMFSILLVVVGVLVLVGGPETRVEATPSGNGVPVFSVSMIGPAHDITPVPNGAGDTCTASDVLYPPVALPGAGCSPRLLPAPPGPVPNTITTAVVDLGLDTAGVFTDDLDALSFGETAGSRVITDYDFSVDPLTVGGPIALCPVGPSNVTLEAALLEAHGDIFTTLGMPAGCNQVAPSGCVILGPCDEATLGLIAPNPAAPAVPPLDNVDAIAEMPSEGGACVWGGIGRICPALSLAPGSATLGLALPAPCTMPALPPDAATIFVPPSALPNPPCLPGGCPAGGVTCVAVHSSQLGLMPGDDLDALCWFDRNGDRTVDLPTTVAPTGDNYLFSLAPGSPTLGVLGASAADILAPAAGGPVVSVPAASLGLLPTDNIDGLTCHLATTDGDGDGYSDIAENGAPLCAGAVSQDSFEDAVVNDGCPALGAGEAACMDAVDSDADGLVNDGCPVFLSYSEGPQCNNAADEDGDGSANDGCPARGGAEAICGPAADDDLDGSINDGCPVVAPAAELANNITTRPGSRCEVGPTSPSTAWPPDLAGAGASTDVVTLPDITSFVAPIPKKFNTAPGMAGFNSRWDLVPGSGGAAMWIILSDITALTAGQTAFPPMFGGVRAFNGPLCTDP